MLFLNEGEFKHLSDYYANKSDSLNLDLTGKCNRNETALLRALADIDNIFLNVTPELTIGDRKTRYKDKGISIIDGETHFVILGENVAKLGSIIAILADVKNVTCKLEQSTDGGELRVTTNYITLLLIVAFVHSHLRANGTSGTIANNQPPINSEERALAVAMVNKIIDGKQASIGILGIVTHAVNEYSKSPYFQLSPQHYGITANYTDRSIVDTIKRELSQPVTSLNSNGWFSDSKRIDTEYQYVVDNGIEYLLTRNRDAFGEIMSINITQVQ